MSTVTRKLAPIALLALLVAGCGGGRAHGHAVVVDDGYYHDGNPGLELVGLWTGTFTDQYGDYTASIEIDADSVVPAGDPGWAFLVWGEESTGLSMTNGEFVEIGYARYSFVYDAVDPATGGYVDTVSGELTLVDWDYLEGFFETSSGTSGQVSFFLNQGVGQGDMRGRFAMTFSDSETRETYYLGEVEDDRFGDVIRGSWSYLTDDVSGPIDPSANVWPILDGYVALVDPDTGYFEGALYFDSPSDTILLSGYLGTDLGVYAGIFEDRLGTGLFSFAPVE